MFNVEAYKRHLADFFNDTAKIYRKNKVKNKETNQTELVPELIHDDVPCRMSRKQAATVNQTEAENDIQYETKLLLFNDIEIKQGDLLEVTRGLYTHKYTAGEPFPYPTHQELSIQRKDWA